MLRKSKYKRELENLAKKRKNDYFSSLNCASLYDKNHIMFMKEDLSEFYPSFEEYSYLEKVDLIDYRKFNGRNKKRRCFLCRP